MERESEKENKREAKKDISRLKSKLDGIERERARK